MSTLFGGKRRFAAGPPSTLTILQEGKMAATEQEIDDAIRKRAPKFRAEAETITMRIVRRLLEEDLGLPAGSLEPQKKYISTAVDRVLNEATGSNGAANYGANAVVPAIPKAAPADRGQQGKTPVENPEAEERLEASEEEEQVVHRKQKAKGNLGGKHGQRQVQMEEEDSEDEAEEESEKEESEEEDRIQTKILTMTRTKQKGRKMHKPAPDDEEEETEGSSGASEESDEEEAVVRKRSRKEVSKGKKKQSKPDSDEEGSAEESGSSEDEQPAPSKRRKTGEESSSEAESGQSADSEEEPSRKQKSRKEAVKKKGKDEVPSKPPQAAYLTSKRVVELKSILKQCGITVPPAVYKKAKDADAEDRQDVLIRGLKDLLKKEGLSGHPSDQEIKRVRKRLQTQKELEGIDTENIIEEGGRGSRRAAREAAAKVPRYTEASDSDENDEEDEGEEDEEESGDDEEDDDED